MRTRLLRGLAVGALAVLSLTACSTGEPDAATTTVAALPTASAPEPSDDVSVPDLTDESCQKILAEVAGAREALNSAVDDIMSAPDALAQVADNLRAAAADANAELSAAVEDLAAAYDDTADKLRSGQFGSLDMEPLLEPLPRLFTLCKG